MDPVECEWGHSHLETWTLGLTLKKREPERPSRRPSYWMYKRKLPSSVSRRIVDSSTRRVGESLTTRLGESGSCYLEFFKFIINLQTFKQLNLLFQGPIWQKRSQGCNVLSLLIYLKVWKKGKSCRLPDLASRVVFFHYEYLREFKAKIGTARKVVLGTHEEPIYAKIPENALHCHVPLKNFSFEIFLLIFSYKDIQLVWTPSHVRTNYRLSLTNHG